jgi:hypothetical protein
MKSGGLCASRRQRAGWEVKKEADMRSEVTKTGSLPFVKLRHGRPAKV